MLYKYLTIWGKGIYCKRITKRDKRKFKEEYGWEIKLNPISRLVNLMENVSNRWAVYYLVRLF